MPWSIRNALVFDAVVPISTNVGSVVAGANCQPAYEGRYTGSWIPACAFGAAPPPRDGRDYHEAELARRWLDAGWDYAVDNPERWPAVVSLRVLRTWGLWQPRLQASAYEGQNRGFARLAVLAFFPVALNAFAAVRGVDRMLLVKARALGARPHQVYLKVVVPAALPTVVVGLRLGATYAFVGIVATEMISSFDGIGYLLGYYTLLFQSGKTYGYILVALLLAFALNATLRAIETRAGRWR